MALLASTKIESSIIYINKRRDEISIILSGNIAERESRGPFFEISLRNFKEIFSQFESEGETDYTRETIADDEERCAICTGMISTGSCIQTDTSGFNWSSHTDCFRKALREIKRLLDTYSTKITLHNM